jgi:hypothetical protein
VSEDNVKIVVGMSVNYAINTTNEDVVDTGYTRAEWDALDDESRDEEMRLYVEEHVSSHLDSWWREAGED